jgi:hypothetical protein
MESKQGKGQFNAGWDSEYARKKKTNRECLMSACHESSFGGI